MHEHEHSTAPEPERPARQVSPAAPEHPILALQRHAGNRAVGRMLARMTPEEAMKDLEDVSMNSVRPDGPHMARQVSAFAFDREGWGKVGEAYKKAHEDKPIEPPLAATEAKLPAEEAENVNSLKPR